MYHNSKTLLKGTSQRHLKDAAGLADPYKFKICNDLSRLLREKENPV